MYHGIESCDVIEKIEAHGPNISSLLRDIRDVTWRRLTLHGYDYKEKIPKLQNRLCNSI